MSVYLRIQVINCVVQFWALNLWQASSDKGNSGRHHAALTLATDPETPNGFYLSYLFDLFVMPLWIQSHCHLSKKPIVALLTTASSCSKCANLILVPCRIHIKMSHLYLIALFLTVNVIIILQTPWLKTNMIPINVWKAYMKENRYNISMKLDGGIKMRDKTHQCITFIKCNIYRVERI